jgi:hypothetical protein
MEVAMSLNDTTNEVPYGYCHCGCGQLTPIAQRAYSNKGIVKGEPLRYLSGHKLRIPASERFWAKIQKTDSCWLWTGGCTGSGYGVIEIPGHGRRSIAVHRLSWEIHNGPIPEGMVILHLCDVRNCVRPDHLCLGTQADNVNDCVSKGRNRYSTHHLNGELNGNSKLTAEQVAIIRSEYATGTTSSIKLAAVYGVSKPTILRIIHGETWSHV